MAPAPAGQSASQALALTQQLAFRLNDKDFAAVDIVLLPPFTALRSVQTLIQGDKLKLQYGAQDGRRTRRIPRESPCGEI